MPKAKIPGSARDGAIDSRSSDAGGRQADETTPHAERAEADKAGKPATRPARDEVRGALKDQTAR